MWPFKKDKVELVETYNNETGLGMPPCTRTCVECGHLVAADRAVEVEHLSGTYTWEGEQISTKEYFCEEHAPSWRRVYSYAGIVKQYSRTRTQVTTYTECGQVLREWFTS